MYVPMSTNEKDAILGRAVRDAKEAETELALLKAEIGRVQTASWNLSSALGDLMTGKQKDALPFAKAIDDAGDLVSLVERFVAANERAVTLRATVNELLG